MNDLLKFKQLYAETRTYLKQGNAQEARKDVLAILDILYAMRLSAPTVMARAKANAMIEQFLSYARILRMEGVTPKVLEAFGLIENKAPMPETPPSYPPKIIPRAPRAAQPKPPVEVPSQGWVADLFERYQCGVVRVVAQSVVGYSNGTGFVISKNGLLLTNEHVVYDEAAGRLCTSVAVSFGQDSKQYDAHVVASDGKYDLALLQLERGLPTKAVVVPRIRDYSAVKQGADVILIGNAFSMGLAPIPGTIKFTHEGNSGDLVYTAPSNPGDSGGPVFNRNGECIGINKSVTSAFIRGGQRVESQGLTNATPMDFIDERLAAWTKKYSIEL